ncbi:nucleoside phosphorylase domain-containing protein [Tricladium varicosporioides]|nr:nucleoside phosphorylase domain-containing protein [Hymenoscyphus varicosporioides]
MRPRKLTHDAYTVGWICVIEPERDAVRALLDAEDEQLPAGENDDNSYLLGRIGQHNVIRFGLMVGVGGGVPRSPHSEDSREDIRLGDIVPPVILLKAIKRLQWDHRYKIGEMHQYIHEVTSKIADLDIGDYRFPGRSQDLLYKADYPHTKGEGCSACDINETEKRICRASENPIVHYGLIASGNGVIKSIPFRDKLRDDLDVSCFEMEAAGLMDYFPCISIRGICDYSDSHKNKIWQPYSAVVAAAYAKDLLRVIHPKDVENSKAAIDAIKECKSISALYRL